MAEQRGRGDRGYRYAHFEAGAIGHLLHLAAEALGATGIGSFYDDEVHRYLNLVYTILRLVIPFPIRAFRHQLGETVVKTRRW